MPVFCSNAPGFRETQLGRQLQKIDYVFLAFFTLEAMFKIVAMGLVMAPNTYLRNGERLCDAPQQHDLGCEGCPTHNKMFGCRGCTVQSAPQSLRNGGYNGLELSFGKGEGYQACRLDEFFMERMSSYVWEGVPSMN
eukprot:scaffold215392_cov19-Tisochrysis_lutea.AAC.1